MTNEELIEILSKYPKDAKIRVMDAGVSKTLFSVDIVFDPDKYDLFTEEDTFNPDDIKAIIFDPGNYIYRSL